MKATELMIGDWVYAIVQVDDTGTEPVFKRTPARVTSLVNLKYGIFVEGASQFAGAEIEPIPITPEILDKIGRNSRGCYPDSSIWEIPCGGLDVIYVTYFDKNQLARTIGKHIACIQIGEVGRSDMWLCKYINYVHELQHALKIAGIDKEVVLTFSVKEKYHVNNMSPNYRDYKFTVVRDYTDLPYTIDGYRYWGSYNDFDLAKEACRKCNNGIIVESENIVPISYGR